MPAEDAVWIAASIGVMQVAGRVLELTMGSRQSSVRIGLVTFVGLCLAMLLLRMVEVAPAAVFAFAIVYGMSNGLQTIAKATLPVEMFGLTNVGVLLGSFSAPSLVTRAVAPFAFAVASRAIGTTSAIMALAAVAFASLGAYGAAVNITSRYG
jgi:hypothetical protein